METERLHNSLATQASYYFALIQKNLEWEYAVMYENKAITRVAASKNSEFMHILTDFDTRKIDIILSQSILSLSRNTVYLLETVRHLKNLCIEVQFEKEIIKINGKVKVIIARAITNMKLFFENKMNIISTATSTI